MGHDEGRRGGTALLDRSTWPTARRGPDRISSWPSEDRTWLVKRQGFDTPLPSTPNVEFRAPQTQERFELWGVNEGLSSPKLPLHRPLTYLYERGRRWTQRFTQVRATLRCNTLLLLCGGLASRGAEDEQVQGMNDLLRYALEWVPSLDPSIRSTAVAHLYL
jgi:hypothetical protein